MTAVAGVNTGVGAIGLQMSSQSTQHQPLDCVSGAASLAAASHGSVFPSGRGKVPDCK